MIFNDISDIEVTVENFHGTTRIESLGSSSWLSSVAKALENLNAQAACEAKRGSTEFVRNTLAEKNKLPTIVKEILILEIWREEVLPLILEKFKPKHSFNIYMVLFYEANLANLLETILFDGPTALTLGDSAVDLVDYCMRRLTRLICDEEEYPNKIEKILFQQVADVDFQVGIKCISILYYLVEHIEYLVLEVSSRLAITHDVPVLLIKLLRDRPWQKAKENKIYNYQGNDWHLYEDCEIPDSEVLVWTSLWAILTKSVTSEKYRINDYRRHLLLKILPLLTDELKIRAPFLGDFKRRLMELEICNSRIGGDKSLLFIEGVAEIREALLREYRGSYESIAETIGPFFSEEKDEQLVKESSFLLDILENESVQDLMFATPSSVKPCAVCQRENSKNICSGCKKIRYCGRECQSKHWSLHKKVCNSDNNSPDKIQVIS